MKNSDYSIEYRGSFIHVRHERGSLINLEMLNRLYKDLGEIGKKFNCNLVFVEGIAIKRKLDIVEAFDSGNEIARIITGLSLAFYFKGYQPDEMSEFFKTVSRNRGARVEFFSSCQDAFRWLGINPPEKAGGRKTKNSRQSVLEHGCNQF